MPRTWAEMMRIAPPTDLPQPLQGAEFEEAVIRAIADHSESDLRDRITTMQQRGQLLMIRCKCDGIHLMNCEVSIYSARRCEPVYIEALKRVQRAAA